MANNRSPNSSARRAASSAAHRVDLAQLLVDLRAHAAGIRPVEADAPGAFAELGGARQRGQRQRHVGEFAGRRVGARRAFTRLVFFPGAIQFGADSICASPNTCGCRAVSLSEMASATLAKSNQSRSAPICA